MTTFRPSYPIIPPLVPMIAVPGGPLSGASQVLREVGKILQGKVLVVPESATQCLTAGLHPDRDGLDAFQAEVFWNQVRNENHWNSVARRLGYEALILDRTPLDGGADIEGGIERHCATYGVTYEGLLARYTDVVYLESIATRFPELYVREQGNKVRLESDPRLVADLDRKTLAIYEKHPSLTVIESTIDFAEKCECAVNTILRLTLNYF